MKFKNTAIIVAAFLIGNTNTWAAEVSNSQEKSTRIANSQEVTTQSTTAQDWGLSLEEWQRYKRLIQGSDGLWYPHLSPPAMLGMRTETPKEQKHFAEIVARQEHDKVARELAFNQAVWVAMRSLYADEPIIRDFDKTPFNPGQVAKSNSIVLQAG